MLLRAVGLVALLGFLVLPRAAEPQQATKMHRIGVLAVGPLSGYAFTRQFPAALRDLGYVEGQNVVLEWRSADGRPERLTDLAAELVRVNADVIVALTNTEILAAKRATTAVPIIMAAASDPVAAGLVASLARPGGTVTGGVWFTPETGGKILAVLKETVPKARRVVYLVGADFPGLSAFVQAVQAAALTLDLTLQVVEVRSSDSVVGVLEKILGWRPDALLVAPTGTLSGHREAILKFAAQNRLPAIYTVRGWIDAGGLMAYTPSALEAARRAARYVDRIVKGAKPADLPVEQPTLFELVINQKSAAALGLTIPPSVLLRADEVIQ